jgi:hypothetical protein
MQHRIFLVPGRPGVPRADADGHWRTHHARLMLDLPLLLGYVQNRPLPGWWPHLGALACSETWFASREAEREAYASDWYRDAIAPDEHRMFARDAAWHARVLEVEELHPGEHGAFRALAFGGVAELLGDAILDARLERLVLSRAAPGTHRAEAIAAWSDDPMTADHLARRLGGVAFAAEHAVIVPAPAVS